MLNVRHVAVLSAAALMMLSPTQVLAATKSSKAAISYPMAIPSQNRKVDAMDAIIQKARSNPSFEFFYHSWEGGLMRARMDREVYKLMETDPVAKAAFAEVLAQSTPVLNATETQHDDMGQRYAKGYASGKYFNMVKEVAKDHNMNPDDVVLWIMNGEINAYTFSASRIRLVLYQQLLDIMPDEAVHAVVGHELGHIKYNHVDISAVVQAVYDAVGRNMIPNEDTSTTFLSQVQSEGRKLMLQAIDAKGPAAEAFVEVQQRRAAIAGDIIFKEFGPEKVAKLANALHRAAGGLHDLLDAKGNFIAVAETPSADPTAPAKKEPTIEDQKAFKLANTRLTRGIETTADQAAIVNLYEYAYKRATGTHEQRDLAAREYSINAFATSMSILQGGRNADPKAFVKQAYDRLERAQVTREDLSKVEKGDHPSTLFRIIEAIRFQNTPEFKIETTPFLRGLNLYAALINQISTDSGRMKTRSLELPTSEFLDHRDQGFTKVATAIETQIIREIVAETKVGGASTVTLLLQTLDKMDGIEQLPLINALRTEMRALKLPLADKIADAIDTRVRVSDNDQSILDIAKAAEAAKPAPKPTIAPTCQALFK